MNRSSMKKHVFMCFFFISFYASAQFNDQFSDGELTTNPLWSGDVTNFTVSLDSLRSNGPAATASIYLSTPTTLINNTVWEFSVKLDFAPSASNQVNVYLVSDNANLLVPLNGYYISIGQAGDDQIKLYKHTGSTASLLFTGNSLFTTSPVKTRIKVVRDNVGNWEVSADNTGGVNFVSEGAGFFDDTFKTTSFFGVVCNHTSTRKDLFYFDDFSVASLPDTKPPTVIIADVISYTEIDVIFDEPITASTAELITNYAVNGNIGNPVSAIVDGLDNTMVHLTFSVAFTNNTNYVLTTSNVTDENNNVMLLSTTNFHFIIPDIAAVGDIIINEFMADPNPPIGLPDAEFVEIFNASTKIIDLQNYTLSGSTISTTSYPLLPNEYLILCNDADSSLFQPYGSVLGVPTWNILSNTGETITLKDENNLLIIDELTYNDNWYVIASDVVPQKEGTSLERINPFTPCNNKSNWFPSYRDPGGSPGQQNVFYSDVSDTIPPTIIALAVIDVDSIAFQFNEPINSATIDLGSYTITPTIGVQRAYGIIHDDSWVILKLTNQLQNDILYNLRVGGILDCSGNTVISEAIDFRLYETAQAKEIVINEIMVDPTPSLGLPESEYIELYNNSNKYLDLNNYKLNGVPITNINYFDPPLYKQSNVPDNYKLNPGEYVILSPGNYYSQFETYGKTVWLAAWNMLTNTGETVTLSEINGGNIIDQVSYTIDWYSDTLKENGGYSLELINPNSPCSGQYNWRASNNVSGGTPGVINSTFMNNPDITPPSIVGVELLSNDSLLVEFNEPIDLSSLPTAIFNLSPTVGIQEVLPSATSQFFVVVKMTTPLPQGVQFELSVSNLSDCSGNLITNSSAVFRTYEEALEGEILINEIMADPFPSVGLPEAEYVELYNASNKYFDLKGYTLSNAAIITTTYEFAPSEHLVLCKSGEEVFFEPYGNVIGVPSWNVLTNTGKKVMLKNSNNGVVIDEVNYSNSWYQDTQKDNGGFSLELINPNSLCKGASNWSASIHQEGGTPGYQNSVFNNESDIEAPKLISVAIISEDTIVAQFDEFLDASSLPLSSFSITSSATVSVIGLSSDSKSVLLKVSEMLLITETYTLSVNGLSDCLGNIMLAEETTFFQLPEVANPKDIIISEFMPDPLDQVGLPKAEFVELYNRSNKQFNLANYTLNGKPVSIDYYQFLPNEYVILCVETERINYASYGNTIGMASWDILSNSGETISLVDTKNKIKVDELHYTRSWYNSTIKDQGGWSLEIIDTENLCSNEENWTASVQPTGGTPGAENSVKASKPDLSGPRLEDVVVIATDTLLLSFNENLDSMSILFGSYSVDGMGDLSVTFTSLKHVKLKLQTGLLPKKQYTVTVNNLTDCAGNIISNEFNTASFALPEEAESGDIVLNEVLFNPRANAPDFVELYNTSDKYIDLHNWFIANKDIDGKPDNLKIITDNPFVIAPRQFLVLTKDATTLANEYPNGNIEAFLEIKSIPNYNDDNGSVVILKEDSSLYEVFDYNEDMHHPLLNNVEGVSLEKIKIDGLTNDPDNWHSASSIIFATPGHENSQSSPEIVSEGVITISPQVIIPNQNGIDDFSTIHYEFDKPGYVVSVYIIDDRGRMAKRIMENNILPLSGDLHWDGTLEDGRKARIGSYMVFMEVFDTNGEVKHYRKRVVLASEW